MDRYHNLPDTLRELCFVSRQVFQGIHASCESKATTVEIVDSLLVVTFQEPQRGTKVPAELTLLWLCQGEPKLSVVRDL